MDQGNPEWPAFFPEGTPPADSTPAEGQVYRLVDSVPSTPLDFKSNYEKWPTIEYDSIEEACGVSFCRDSADLRRRQRRFKKLRGKKIAQGVLHPHYGLMKETPRYAHDSHITVWFRVGATPEESFVVEAA